jgi:hypothetical protein
MRRTVTVPMIIGALVAMSFLPANGAEQKPGVTNQPKAMPKTAPATPALPQGVIVNQLQAQTGFVFEAGPTKNQVTARKAGGALGGLGASASCGCASGAGTCTLVVTGGLATCTKESGNTCLGDCTFTTMQPSSGGIMMRK